QEKIEPPKRYRRASGRITLARLFRPGWPIPPTVEPLHRVLHQPVRRRRALRIARAMAAAPRLAGRHRGATGGTPLAPPVACLRTGAAASRTRSGLPGAPAERRDSS